MPQTVKHSARELGSRNARLKLKERPQPYFAHVKDALSVGYRKGKRGGTWIARTYDLTNGYRFQPLGVANDLAEDVGLTFDKAQDEAKRWYVKLLKSDSEPEPQPVDRCTVADAMADYIADSERVKRRSLPDTRAAINAHIIPSLGAIELSKLTHPRLTKWRNALADTAPRQRTKTGETQKHRDHDASDTEAVRKRQATVNRVLTILKAALNHAKTETKRVASDEAWADVKPFRRVDVAKVRFLTDDEVTGLITCCPPKFEALVKGALLTGCRYGELTALQAQHFDEEQGTIFVAQSKNGESRHVALNDEGITLFKELTLGKAANDHVFTRTNGRAWRKSEQKRPIDAACDLAMIEAVTFHILRHTYASHAVMNGMPLAVLAEQLGHKDTRITEKHYAHLCKSYKHRLVRANAPGFGFSTGAGNGEDAAVASQPSERKTGRILPITGHRMAS